MPSVKIMGGPMKEPPKPTRDADIEGQGKIPYCTMQEEKRRPARLKAKLPQALSVVWVRLYVVVDIRVLNYG